MPKCSRGIDDSSSSTAAPNVSPAVMRQHDVSILFRPTNIATSDETFALAIIRGFRLVHTVASSFPIILFMDPLCSLRYGRPPIISSFIFVPSCRSRCGSSGSGRVRMPCLLYRPVVERISIPPGTIYASISIFSLGSLNLAIVSYSYMFPLAVWSLIGLTFLAEPAIAPSDEHVVCISLPLSISLIACLLSVTNSSMEVSPPNRVPRPSRSSCSARTTAICAAYAEFLNRGSSVSLPGILSGGSRLGRWL